jgi:predicted ribosome quality control (RQC) complex YloA/Tae2 family protein
MEDTRPWTDPKCLADALARCRDQWAGRPLFRIAAGPDWIRLHLEGDDRPAILLTTLPGAVLSFGHTGPLPRPLIKALEAVPKHALPGLLTGARLVSCGMLPGDRVACFHLGSHAGDRYLLHQMFGSRGNTVLLDADAALLWSRHRPPHQLLSEVPPEATWSHGDTSQADTLSDPSFAHLAAVALRRETESLRGRLLRKLRAAERLTGNLRKDLDNAEKGDLFRRRAEALAANLHDLAAGPEAFELIDPRDGETLTVPVDPALTPAANMDEWFRRARKAVKGREVVAERLDEAQQELETIREAAAALEFSLAEEGTDVETLERLQDWQDQYPDLIAPPKKGRPGGKHGPEAPARPFRRYLIEGRWEVWIGRNNKENDELTHRAAHAKDIWLHAQGVSGSHVILRAEGNPDRIPAKIIAKAAALAALHSKAKHAGLVPVIWTERRYVRKPRKALPGTAVCLQEKNLFVEPGIGKDVVAI